MDEERKRLRMSFDGDPGTYDMARPGYPEHLYSDIVRDCGLEKHSRLLEIGCGTGKATMVFAAMGYRVDAVEIGARMAKFAAAKTAGYRVNVVNMPFEDWDPEGSVYDLVFAATAFHWIDQQGALAKAARALKEGGHLAVFWHSHIVTEETRESFAILQHAYEDMAPPIARTTVRKKVERSAPEFHAMLRESGIFSDVRRSNYHFTVRYNPDEYIRLLSTYSDHIMLDAGMKNRLFAEIRKLVGDMPSGQIVKEYETVLFTARKTGGEEKHGTG